jgi:predicted DsbA family dithiol-disulfide isomerase
MTRTNSLRIDIVFDVVCPWCWIGDRRLRTALQRRPGVQPELHWHPFLLHPGMPAEGMARDELLREKFGSPEAGAALIQRVTEAGAGEGLEMNYDRIEVIPDTTSAHCLVQWAAAQGLQQAVVERLMRGYFNEGRDVGRADVLAELAGQAGMDAARVRERLEVGEDRERIREQADAMRRQGVTGVPCFVIGQRYVVTGAQDPEAIGRVIDRVVEPEPTRREPLPNRV